MRAWNIAFGLLLIALTVGSGCGGQKKAAPKPEPAPKEETASLLPGKVQGTGWRIRWQARNAKNPEGPPIPVLFADARRGALADATENATVQLEDVRARMFREGKPSANVKALRITANQRDRIVIGTGGVRVNSLTNPPDTVVTADKITWDTRSNKIVAVGHAQVTQRARNGNPSTTHTGGRITFDTKLEEFEIQ